MLSQLEIFNNIESQIERAVQLGQDNVVQALDREIDPLLDEILARSPANAIELQKQLKFITDLLVRRSDDAATVVRLSAKLSQMISHYFQDGQITLRDKTGAANFSITPAVTQAAALPAQALGVARVAVISTDYRFLYCNAVMSADLNYSPRQLVGRPIGDFCNMAVFRDTYQTHLDMCLAGAFREFDAPSLTGQGERPDYHIRLTPLRNIERRITGVVLVAQAEAMQPAAALEH